MNIDTLVYNWLLGGADPEVGCRLFMDYCNPTPAIARTIQHNPSRHLQTIRTALYTKANIPLSTDIKPSTNKRTANYTGTIRSNWPFLADVDCPPELKLLISDKITAYRNCIKHYEAITQATSIDDQLNTVRSLVTNFIENHDIYKELKHYKDHRKLLGEHPIFTQFEQIKSLRKLNTIELFKKKKNLEHAIWRNETKIKKENRPDLLHSREQKIKQLKRQLAEVDRLLS